MACYAVKCLTVPGMPNNEGAVAPIRVSARQDSILNAQPHYPTGGRHVTGHMVVPLVFRTLADAVPGRVQADCGMMNIVTFQGTNPAGQPMSTIYFSTGGFGALQGLDGGGNHPGPVQHEDRTDRDVGVADRHHHRTIADPHISTRLDMRYQGQGYEIEVTLPDGGIGAGTGAGYAESFARLDELFRARYAEIFAETFLDDPLEIVSWKVEAAGEEAALADTAGGRGLRLGAGSGGLRRRQSAHGLDRSACLAAAAQCAGSRGERAVGESAELVAAAAPAPGVGDPRCAGAGDARRRRDAGLRCQGRSRRYLPVTRGVGLAARRRGRPGAAQGPVGRGGS